MEIRTNRGALHSGDIRSIFEWIKKNIFDPETRNPLITTIYCGVAMVMLMNHVYITVYFPKTYNIIVAAQWPWTIFAIVSIILGRMWRDKGFWIFMALLLVKFLRYYIPSEDVWNSIPCTGFYFIGGCYSVGRILSSKDRKRFIIAFCAVWTIAMVVFSCLCIHVAWTWDEIKNLGNGGIRIGYGGENRLYPIYHPVQAGVLASASLAVVLVGFYTVKNKVWKALFLVGFVIEFIFGILTTSRVTHIVNGFLASAFVCIIISGRIKGPMKTWQKILIPVGGIILFVLFVYIHSFGIKVFNDIRNGRGMIISSAYADTVTGLKPRDINLDHGLDAFLNGRIDIWESTFHVLKENPDLLLWGRSGIDPFGIVNEYRYSKNMGYRAHTHNTWLQILLENGIPGLLLYLAFSVLLFVH